MDNFVDIHHVEIGGQSIETVKSFAPDVNDPKAPVKTMNRARRPLGFTRGVPEFPVKISAVIPLVPEVDWQGWCLRGEEKTITFERGDNGTRVTLSRVAINSVNEKADEGGEAMYDIDAVALDYREE